MGTNQKKTVYFVRHGQSEHNAAPIFQSPDSRLSQQGIAQAKTVAERLANTPFETLIASPFPRAQQTAQAIADKTEHEIITSDLFVERRKPSAVLGKPYTDEIATKLYQDYMQTMYGHSGHISDAENYDDLILRADKALTYLVERPETTMVVVTHGWFLRAVIARVLLGDQLTGAALQRFEELITVNNTSITVLNYRDAYEEDFRWRLWTLNDHGHFAE